MAPKKFTVAKLTEITQPGENPYVIVPTSWIKRKDDQYVMVPYPPRDLLPLAFERIVTCQPALAEWEDHQSVIEREAGKLFCTPHKRSVGVVFCFRNVKKPSLSKLK